MTIESVDEGDAVLKGSEVLFDAENFSFEVHSVSATYRGALSADGKRLSGTWIQRGTPFPLDLTPQTYTVLVLSFVAIAIAAFAALFTLLRFDEQVVAALLARALATTSRRISTIGPRDRVAYDGLCLRKVGEAADARRYPAPRGPGRRGWSQTSPLL